MDGYKYEQLVAQYLKKHGYKWVSVTQASADYGVDITAVKGGHKYAIQCKYYSSPVGVAAVQEVVAGKNYYHCDRAMVVTNSTFTRAATELASVNNVVLLEGVKGSGVVFNLSTKIKAVLILGYLFISSAIMAAAIEQAKNVPLQVAIYNIISVILFLSFPLWVKYAVKLVWSIVKFFFTWLKEKCVKHHNQPVAPMTERINTPIIEEHTEKYNTLPLQLPDIDFDPLFSEAVAVAMDHGSFISTALLQRYLRIHYARAEYIASQMEAVGFIGPFEGSRPRPLLISKEQWEATKASIPNQVKLKIHPSN